MTKPDIGVKLRIKNGYAACPRCGTVQHQLLILPETAASNVKLRCSRCKLDMLWTIVDGSVYSKASDPCVNRQCP